MNPNQHLQLLYAKCLKKAYSKKLVLVSLAMFTLILGVFAQTTVSGKVTGEDGLGIPQVSVTEKGKQTGTSTSEDGSFTLTVSNPKATLVMSSVGFIKQEIPVNNRTSIFALLKSSNTKMEEVVVVGYGTQKKATLTGSVSAVKGSELIKSPATNVSNSLAGRLPGLVTVTPSSEPGNDGSALRIRGINTLNNNNPLVVVDGVPGRSLDRIDPSTIENISVLKDASAAIYGAQAANGVILITTKRGKTGKPTITASFNQGWGAPTVLPKMADAATYATMINEIATYAGRSPVYTADDIRLAARLCIS